MSLCEPALITSEGLLLTSNRIEAFQALSSSLKDLARKYFLTKIPEEKDMVLVVKVKFHVLWTLNCYRRIIYIISFEIRI